jgi:hypothetical protein
MRGGSAGRRAAPSPTPETEVAGKLSVGPGFHSVLQPADLIMAGAYRLIAALDD